LKKIIPNEVYVVNQDQEDIHFSNSTLMEEEDNIGKEASIMSTLQNIDLVTQNGTTISGNELYFSPLPCYYV
jgi:hypothetical protein